MNHGRRSAASDFFNSLLIEKFESEKKAPAPDEIFDVIEKCTDRLRNLPLIIVKDNSLRARYTELVEQLKEAIALTE
jgi:hypothetical protein